MKSAYELAMERMGGGEDKPLTDEQKEKIAEVVHDPNSHIFFGIYLFNKINKS